MVVCIISRVALYQYNREQADILISLLPLPTVGLSVRCVTCEKTYNWI